VATRRRSGEREFANERGAAVGTDEGDLGDDLIDGLRRFEGAKGAFVSRLAARFATGGRALRSGFPRRGGIGRRRAGRVGGVLLEARFQDGQAGL
jgi:hypothetical protein